MADYYSILGLTKTATEIEIKAAFRRLAKIYHPDKNPNDPNAKHLFENILRAYNVLSNPHSRKRYDNSNFVTHSQTHRPQRPGQPKQKDYSFTEEDLKRREYYKKHYQAKKNTVNQTPQKPHYSDYKYILYATPIAVGLLMLIMSIFSAEPAIETISQKTEEVPPQTKTSVTMVNGDKPYSGYFGNLKMYETPHHLKINNSSNYDAVIAVFDKKTNNYLQHSYLQASYSIEFSKLPDTGVYWKCVLGKNWNIDKAFLDTTIYGGFDSIVQFQNWKNSPVAFSQNAEDEVYILYAINPDSKNKQYISDDIEFFKK
jgi:hypothetical protein